MQMNDVYAGLNTKAGWKLSMFSDDDIQRIHEATLYVLEKTGVQVLDEKALDVFEEGGCIVDREKQVVKFPSYIVEQATAQAPANILLAGRDPKHDYVTGGRKVGFKPFGVGLKFEDLDRGVYRDSMLKDCADTLKLCDALDTVILNLPPVMANDMPSTNFELYMAAEGFKNTAKPFQSDAMSGEIAEKMVQMAEMTVGGSKELRDRPILTLAVCPVSPLKLPKECLEVIMVAAEHGVPVEILSMAMAGASSPMTLSGTMVVHNAEVLAGIVLAQLVKPGAPCIYGSSTTIFDMKYASASVGGPEFGMLNAALAEMAHFYEVPVTVGGL